MNDTMIDLMAGDTALRGRLEAYVESRLTPDLATSSRIRARVLAVAHRQADLARVDAALIIVPARSDRERPAVTGSTLQARRATMAALLAASLMVGSAAGAALAARPGGALYESRLWVETMALPADPSARAIAQLQRLEDRLRETDAAARAGDLAAANAALAAYGRILDQASTAAIDAHDEVAVAVLETGVGRNLDVLQALVQRVPTEAGEAIDRVIDRAIERTIDRSGETIETIVTSKPDRPARGSDGGAPPVETTPKPTRAPTAKPTKPAVTGPTDTSPKSDPTPDRIPARGGG